MATDKTKTPSKSGLSIARKNNNFVLTWTPCKDCEDQDVKVYVNNECVHTEDLGASTKKYTYTINRSNFFPNKVTQTVIEYVNGQGRASTKQFEGPKLKEVAFRLRQKQKKKKTSEYSDQKEFTIKAPNEPKYVLPAQDSNNNNVFTYSWEKDDDDGDYSTGHVMFTRYRWETCLVPESESADWDLAKSQKITTIDPENHSRSENQNSYGNLSADAIKQVIIVEKEADITAKKRRYFRVRAIGPRGQSSWRNSSHHLGGYKEVKVPTNSTSYTGTDSTGTSAIINLDLGTGYADDSIQVQYAITTPKVNTTTDSENNVVHSSLALPDGFDSWTTYETYAGTGKKDKITLDVPQQVADNEVLFVRVNRIHDNITTYGSPTLMNNRKKNVQSPTKDDPTNVKTVNNHVVYSLSSPTLEGVVIAENSHTVTVSVNNTSGITGSFIAVYQSVNNIDKVIGVISSNQSSGAFPGEWGEEDDPKFGIQCLVADYSPINRAAEGATFYDVGSNVLMTSGGIIWQAELVSKAPILKSLTKVDNSTAYISWDWNWSQADSVEISWSDNRLMWQATEDPSTYVLTNTREGERYVTGLSAGTYYFRLRFIRTTGDTVIYGKYSEIAELQMAEGPTTPTLTLSDEDGIVAPDQEVTVYWKYQSNDGTSQSFARLGEAQNTSSPWNYTEIDSLWTNTDNFIKLTPSALGWAEGSTHRIGVTLMSESGKSSKEGWSEPVMITVANRPSISVTNLSGIIPNNNANEAYDYKLVALPITCTVSGFGGEGYCSVTIERTEAFDISRPDDTHTIGHAGETVYAETYYSDEEGVTSSEVAVTLDKLIGHLDDGAQYLMRIVITDKYGQTDEAKYPFTVVWNDHAQMPAATITIDQVNDIALITPTAQSVGTGDYCQIYRMSADKPQLVLDHGTFGTQYVDIYPTYGRFGGYRIVYVTKNGDYKTAGNLLAMTEYSKTGNDEDIQQYDKFMVSIEFDNNVVEFPGNISMNHSWAKDFQTTRYLGGSIQGDWNPGAIRTGTINGTIPVDYEPEAMYGLRLLADYAGICHIRTPEGSNFYGDIQVRDDREEKWTTRISKISLNYTKVDGAEDQLMTYAEWQARQDNE